MKKFLFYVCLKVLLVTLVVGVVMWGLLWSKQMMCGLLRGQRETGGTIPEGRLPFSSLGKTLLTDKTSGSRQNPQTRTVPNIGSTKQITHQDLKFEKAEDDNAIPPTKTKRGNQKEDKSEDNHPGLMDMNIYDDDKNKVKVNSPNLPQSGKASGGESYAKSYTSDDEFGARRKRVRDFCWENPNFRGDVREIFFNKGAGVLYCVVPKAGCTFWKRIFRAFERKSNPTTADVNNLTRAEIHDEFHGGKGQPYNTTYFNLEDFPTRLLVTRDPFSRLLSAYLDKIYLPDFWNWETKQIAQELNWRRNVWLRSRKQKQNGGSRLTHDDTGSWSNSLGSESRTSSHSNPFEKEGDFLRQHFEYIVQTTEFADTRKRRKTDIPTYQEKSCGKFLSFSQFVFGAVLRAEPHWEPIHSLCNPCALRVSHVSTMETFTQDARPVLRQLGLEDVLDDVTDDEQVDNELTTIVNYNFERVYHERESGVLKPCINPRELAFRLWNNFRWRGYIDPEMDYIVPAFSAIKEVREDLLVQLWRARTSGLQNPEKMKSAKKDFKERAFASLAPELFEKIVEKYRHDIELFGYENKLDELKKLYVS